MKFRGSRVKFDLIGKTSVKIENVLVSISPIFYEQLFCKKVFCATFMCLQFGFAIFWQKDFGIKGAHKMSVKLAPGQFEYWYSIKIVSQ